MHVTFSNPYQINMLMQLSFCRIADKECAYALMENSNQTNLLQYFFARSRNVPSTMLCTPLVMNNINTKHFIKCRFILVNFLVNKNRWANDASTLRVLCAFQLTQHWAHSRKDDCCNVSNFWNLQACSCLPLSLHHIRLLNRAGVVLDRLTHSIERDRMSS